MHYDRVDVSEGTDLAKSNNSRECVICHFWFVNHGFKFQDYVCSGCHLPMLLISAILQLSLLKMLIIVALFIMLKLVPDHLKTKQMCNYAVKKLPYLLRYFLDWYKTKKMCNRAILKIDGTLGFVPGWYKTHEISNKAADNYVHAREFVPDRYKTQEMCIKAVESP